MQFRIRPSSKKSTQEGSLSQFPIKIYDKEHLPYNLNYRIQTLEANQANLQELWRKEREINHASIIQIQKKIDMLQYNTYSHQKDLKQALEIKHIQTQPNHNDYYLAKTDHNLIKEAISQQRQSQLDSASHYQSMFEQISIRQVKLETEMRQLINEQKNQYNYLVKSQSEDIRSSEQLKQRKIDQQYQMIKTMISNSQNQLYEELQRKIRNQSVMKEYIQQQVAELKGEIASQLKILLNAEAKFIRQSKQSVQSLFTIVQSVKSQLKQELSQTQKLSANNFKRVSMSIDMVKDSLNNSINGLISSQQQLSQQMVEFKSFTTNQLEQNRKLLMDLQQNQVEIGQKSFISKNQSAQNGDFSQKFKNLQNEIVQWKNITQQKNLNVFKEISNTLKSIKLQWRKENDQISSQLFSLKETVTSLKKSVPSEIKKSVQTIISVFNNEFDVLAQQLDLMSEMISLSKKQGQKQFKDEIKKNKSQTLEQIKILMDKRTKQNNISLERQISKSQDQIKQQLEKQSKYLLDLLGQKYTGVQTQVNKVASASKKNNSNTKNQLQQFTLKLKAFNQNFKDNLQEQRKDDMKKRIDLEQTMRKNASNLMDICYKKCQFLVEGMKKAIEMNQMKQKMDYKNQIDNIEDQLKKKIITVQSQLRKDFKNNIEKIVQENQNNKKQTQQIKKKIITAQSQLRKDFKINIEKIIQENINTKTQLQIIKENIVKNQEDIKKITQENINTKTQLQQINKTVSKLQIDIKNQIQSEIKTIKEQNDIKQKQFEEEIQKKVSQLRQSIKIDMNNLKLQLEENKQQLQQKIKQLQDQDSEQTKDAISSLRQSLWKIQALFFSQQAKNKAVMDRMSEDVGQLASSIHSIVNQLQSK